MKTNEEIIKELYCNVLLKSMNGASIERAIKDAELAIIAFNNQFKLVDILKPIDSSIIKIWNPEQEKDVLNGLVVMRRFRFKGCSYLYSEQKTPSIDLGGFPYWLVINDEGTLQIKTNNPN
jgi:hypothetical protein